MLPNQNSDQPTTYRPTRSAWVWNVWAVPLLPIGLILFAYAAQRLWQFDLRAVIAMAQFCGLPAILLLAILEVRSLRRAFVYVDSQEIAGIMSGAEVHVPWPDIKAASVQKVGPRKKIALGTSERLFVLDLHYFDEAAIWQDVRTRLPSQYLDEQAFENLIGQVDYIDNS